MEEEASTTGCNNMIKILCDEHKNRHTSEKKTEPPETEMYVYMYVCVS